MAGAVPLRDVDAQVATNVNWPRGMASSLQVGLAAAQAGPWSAAVLLLVDQPWIGPQAVRRLIEARAAGARCAQAGYDGVPGHPVLFAREMLGGRRARGPGRPGRAGVAAHPSGRGRRGGLRRTGDPRDVDRPEDLLDG